MDLCQIINRLIILGFFVLIGYILASCIASGNVIGIILASISLVAGIVFLYLLPKLYEPEYEPEKETAEG
jgi:hypothetical protein